MQELLDFLSNNHSAFNACASFKRLLLDAGFEELDETKSYELKKGHNYFVVRNLSSIMAFKVPSKLDEAAFKIVASHNDCPSFKLKPNCVLKNNNYLRLNTEVYGGPLYYTWFDRPLSLAGRLIYKEGDDLKEAAFDLQEDFCLIPSLAIHMNREANNGYKFNPQVDLLPLVDFDGEFDLLKYLSKKTKSEVIDFDLYLYPRMKACVYEGGEYFSSHHIDDLECAYLSFKAFLESESEDLNAFVAFDNEEVGSLTYQGAMGNFLSSNLRRIAKALGLDLDEVAARSFMVSSDNAHALHPNHEEKADSLNRPLMNEGIVIKQNANQAYTSDAKSMAIFKTILEKADVPYQFFANRSDMRGGSTLGNISNSQISLKSVDIGLAQLAMHSCFETAGLKDIDYFERGLKAFYQNKLPSFK